MSDRLEEIKARRAGISPAPWRSQDHPSETTMVYDATGDSIVYNEGAPNEDDAGFIAHAPEDIDWLVAEIERLRAELAEPEVGLTDPPGWSGQVDIS